MNEAQAHNPDQATATGPVVCGLLAQFENVADLLSAARQVREAGYRRWDCLTPFPVHGLDQAMGARRTRLPWIVLLGGLTGALLGLVLQWWTNAVSVEGVPYALRGYDFVSSGKPLFSLPANIPVIFELTILFSAITTVAAMLLLNRLPRLNHPLLRSSSFRRATSDRFFVAIDADDAKFDEADTRQFLTRLGAETVELIEDRPDE